MTNELVNRFLKWKLPEDFSPDGGINYNKIQYPPHTTHTYTPVGTNLFTADQAKEMFEYLLSDEPQAILSQGEPVAWRQTVHVEEVGIKSIKYFYDNEKIMVDDVPLYLAPPAIEALQKDKAELIKYAENIVGALDAITLFGTDIDKAKEFAMMALDTLQPKCMENI